MTKWFEVKSHYAITDFKEHDKLRERLLESIDAMPYQTRDNITKSDWYVPSNEPRPYLDIFYDAFIPYMDKMMEDMMCTRWVIQNGWFQQYEDSGSHYWHIHPKCMFSNVYFLELPEPQVSTEFLNPITKESFQLENVREGQVITFPSTFIHRSPPNTSGKRKTVIVFNSDIEEVIPGLGL
jgi:hypothetical protein